MIFVRWAGAETFTEFRVRLSAKMSSDDVGGDISDGSATSGEEYVPVKKQQQRRQPSSRAASRGRNARKKEAYVDLSDYGSDSSDESDTAEEADAGSSEDQVSKVGDAVSGAMAICCGLRCVARPTAV